MNYYNFHIGDYISHTIHLSLEEDLAYRRLLDMCYDTELPIPNNIPLVSRKLRISAEVVKTVLDEFFELTEEGYKNFRADNEIAEYQRFIEKQKANGSKGGRPKKSHRKPTANPTESQKKPNQEPRTNNQEPLLKKQRGSRLPQDFVLSKDWADFCTQQRPDLNLQNTFDSFKDFWVAKAGSGGVKLDWLATWRNWVRNQSVPKASFAQIHADIARTTVPKNRDYEETQRRLREEADRNCVAPSLEVLAKMAAIRNGAKENHE
jgi:uncharacterized protein YdaU (DUF1376 family)